MENEISQALSFISELLLSLSVARLRFNIASPLLTFIILIPGRLSPVSLFILHPLHLAWRSRSMDWGYQQLQSNKASPGATDQMNSCQFLPLFLRLPTCYILIISYDQFQAAARPGIYLWYVMNHSPKHTSWTDRWNTFKISKVKYFRRRDTSYFVYSRPTKPCLASW